MDRLNILFPVETINRELDFRLFLGVMCAGKENRVFIGQHDVIDSLVKRMNGGIYLGKNVFKSLFPAVDITPYINLKERKFKFIHLDEEGAVFSGEKDNWRRMLDERINPNYLCEDDYICTWGKYQADYYKARNPACKENIVVTGHPRFDLYKPKFREYFAEKTNRILKKHGEFILINTNLSLSNNGLGLKDTFSERFNFHPESYEKRTHHLEEWSHTTQILANFVRLINRLSGEFPEEKFIVRPHPSEEHQLYETIFRGFPNVEIIHEGTVTPWILASKVLIHDGCTTAIESSLAEKPVITYKSNPDDSFDLFLPDNTGIKCFDNESVIKTIKESLSEEKKHEEKKLDTLVYDLMANFKEDCFQNMLDVIKKAENALLNEKIESIWKRTQFEKDEKIRRAKNKAKSIVRPLFKAKYERYRFLRDNHFYGFETEEINNKLNKIKKILKKEFSYKLYSEDLLSIEVE